MKQTKLQTIFEQIALLFASLVWTAVVLSIIVLFWVYQDVQARWDYVMNAPPEALAQSLPPTPTPVPTVTPWPGPGPTLTPTPTLPPTPTATWVVPPPDLLPETLNPDDPTPIPVLLPTTNKATAIVLNTPPTKLATAPPTATTTPVQSTPLPIQIPSPSPIPPTPAPPTATPPPAQPAAPATANAPTRLVIESVGIDSKVIPVGWKVVEQNGQQYSIWEVADYAVGWHKTSAPLGQPGNTVMAGHHNINGEVFRDLVNVEVGDRVTIYSGDRKFEYVIELKTIVKEKGEPIEVRRRNAQWIAPTDDERITMVTCWPYTNNTHRVIVVAKPL